jgi:hypothetical protein
MTPQTPGKPVLMAAWGSGLWLTFLDRGSDLEKDAKAGGNRLILLVGTPTLEARKPGLTNVLSTSASP